jgi:hypothetical protein
MPLPRLSSWLATAALFLFAGRLLAEWLRPGTAGVVVIALLALLAATLAVRRWPGAIPGQALLLFLYVFYPEADPLIAVLAGFLGLLAALLARVILPSWRWPGLLLFAASLALYTATLAPGLLPADSGELQLVAAELGVAHPPGFPLYTIVAHLFTRLPVGDGAALRVSAFSALTSAATIVLVYLAARRLTGQLVPSLIAGLALMSATTFWSQATTANVRSLAALFAALLFLLLLRWRDQPQNQWRLAAVALALSLGIGHHASLAFIGAVFLLYLVAVDPALLRQPRRWLLPAGTVLAGLLPLLYLPLRAASGAHGADPALATPAGFLEHVLATGFRGDFFAFSSPAGLVARLAVMGNVLRFQFEPLLLGGMLLGLVILVWRREWRPLLLVGGSFAAHTLVTAMYRAPQTVEYMLPAYVAAALLLAAGAAAPWRGRWPVGGQALLQAALLLAAVLQAARHTPSFQFLHQDEDTRRTAGRLLEEAPANSLLLAGWHWATPLWYLQQVEGMRQDVEAAYVFPTAEPYAATWARLIAAGLAENRAVVATHYDELAYAGLPPPLPLGEAYLFPAEPLTALPAGFTPAPIVLGETLQIAGYRLEADTLAPGDKAALTLAWRPLDGAPANLSLFAHLVDAGGALWAQADLAAQAQPDGLSLTRLILTPRPAAPPGAYELLAGAYTADGTLLAGPDGAARVPLAQVTVTQRPAPWTTQQRVHRPLTIGNRTLVGYDWDHTLATPRLYLHWQMAGGYYTEVRDNGDWSLPPWTGPWGLVRTGAIPKRPGQHYVPLGQGIVWLGDARLGETAPRPGERPYLPQRLAASQPVLRDLVVSVRLVGYEPDGFHWAWWELDDGVPALGAIPTLKWVAGSRVWDPHWLRVATDAPPGQELGAFVRLYDAFTGQPLPILDERLVEGLPAIPLGLTTVGE